MDSRRDTAGCARNAATTCEAVLPYCDNAERTGAASLLRPGILSSKPLQIVGRRRPIYLGALLDLLVAVAAKCCIFGKLYFEDSRHKHDDYQRQAAPVHTSTASDDELQQLMLELRAAQSSKNSKV
jgi:hypothetical protein